MESKGKLNIVLVYGNILQMRGNMFNLFINYFCIIIIVTLTLLY